MAASSSGGTARVSACGAAVLGRTAGLFSARSGGRGQLPPSLPAPVAARDLRAELRGACCSAAAAAPSGCRGDMAGAPRPPVPAGAGAASAPVLVLPLPGAAGRVSGLCNCVAMVPFSNFLRNNLKSTPRLCKIIEAHLKAAYCYGNSEIGVKQKS